MATKNKAAQSLARLRWEKTPKEERSQHVGHVGGPGRPRVYPQCKLYKAHRFSIHADGVDRCPCGFTR